MANNKVQLGDGTVLVDMTDATASADKIVSGYTAYGADGTKITGNIANKSSTDLTASGATVTVPAGYYASSATKAVASGTEGTPVATKGTVSNNSVSVTPSITNTAGYIAGGTKTGTAVTVSANELVSGTKTIIDNDSGIDVTNYASVDVNVKPKYTITFSSSGTNTNPYVTVNGTGTHHNNANNTAFTVYAGDYLYFYVGASSWSNEVYINEELVSSGESHYTYYPVSDVTLSLFYDWKTDRSVVRITIPMISITADGMYDVADYASASVDIQPKKTSSDVTVSGETVSVPAGYYTQAVSKSVTTVTHPKPTVSINASTGLVTASHVQATGFTSGGTTTETLQLTTQAAKTVTPTKSTQTAVASGTYTTGAVTVAPIPNEYIDTSDATATASDVMSGKTFYSASGVKTPGEYGRYTATVTKAIGSSQVFRISYNSIRYDSLSSFGFKAGDTITLTGQGVRGGGIVYIDGVLISGNYYDPVIYTYTLPSCDIEIDATTTSDAVIINITTHPTDGAIATSKSILSGYKAYDDDDEIISGELNLGLVPTTTFFTTGELRETFAAHKFIPKYDNEIIIWNITGNVERSTTGNYPYTFVLLINNGVPSSNIFWIRGNSITKPWEGASVVENKTTFTFTIDNDGYLTVPSSGTWVYIAENNTMAIYEIKLPTSIATLDTATLNPTEEVAYTATEIRSLLSTISVKPKYSNSIIFWNMTGSNASTLGNVTPYCYFAFVCQGTTRASGWISGSALTYPWESSASMNLRGDNLSLDANGNITFPSTGLWGYIGGDNTVSVYELELPTVEGAPCSVETTYPLQKKIITPTVNERIIFPDAGYIGLSRAVVNPIPSEYVLTSDATATAEDVLHGKTFYGADGSKVTGIASSVTGQIYQDNDGYLVLSDDGDYDPPKWVRPSEWMPYAKGWSKSSFEGIYYVYDLALNVDENNPRFWALFMNTTVNGGRATIETGYVNPSGVFISETSESWTTGTGKEGFLPYWDGINDYERYFVIRVTPQEGYHLGLVNFRGPSADLFADLYGTITTSNVLSEGQPCIEQYGRLPYLTRISMAYAYRHNHVKTMIHSYLIDVGKGGNLTTLDQAFRYNYGLECIDGLETWDVSNVTNFQYMFATCLPLKYIEGLDDWDLSNATTLARMFNDCRSLVTVGGLKDKDVESVTTIDNMFAGCYSLESLDLSGMSFSSSLTNISSAFYNCSSLKHVDISDWDISPTNSSYLFQNCNRLQSVDVSGVDLSAATTIRAMFQNCYSLFDIKFGTGTTSSLTTAQDFITGANIIRKLDFTGWVFTNVTNSGGFANLNELVSLKGLSVPTSFNISASTMLNTDALVVILTALPIVATTQTITLGTTLKGRLSAEQLAIATEKGWTVA